MKRFLTFFFGIQIVLLLSLPTLWGANEGKQPQLKKAFHQVAEKVDEKVAHLLVSGSQVGYATLISGNYAFTKASLIPRGSQVQIRHQNKVYQAEKLGLDSKNDIILLKIKTSKQLPGFTLQGIKKPRLGSWALSVAADSILKVGIISATARKVKPRKRRGMLSIFGFLGLTGTGPARSYANVIQHDAPVARNQFGSSLVSANGTFLGVNVAFAYRGTGYAISAVHLAKIFSKLKKDQSIKSPFLGVYVKEIRGGLQVESLYPKGPAQKGGIQKGDIITHFKGQKVRKTDQLVSIIKKESVGAKVKVTVRRDGKRKNIIVTLEAKK